MSEELLDLHQLAPARFFEQVHSFEFWFEAVLAETVLKEFKTRLSRIGLEYQSPERP